MYRLLAWLVEFGPSSETSRWLLPTLSLALVVLTLGLAGVLIRNLVKLIIERKRGILGSRLRIKLVFFFLALVLAPAFVLFYGSAHVITRTVDAILRTPLEHLIRGDEVVHQWTEYFEAQSKSRAQTVGAEIAQGDLLEPQRREALSNLLRRGVRSAEGLRIHVVTAEGVLAAAAAPGSDRTSTTEEQVLVLARQALAAGAPVTRVTQRGERLLAEAAVPVGGQTAAAGAVRAAVVCGMFLPDRIAANALTMNAAARGYEQFRVQRRELVRFFLTLIGLIFLATLFVATWIGFYLARRITEPIQQVAAAAREISAGNLNVRVDARAGDETSLLVDSFNEMAAELQENREVITRSTADLRRSNRALDDRRRYIETLVANLSTAVISLDPAGQVTTTNPAAQRILGLSLTLGCDARLELERHGLGALAALLVRSDAAEGTLRRDIELPPSAPAQHVSLQISPLRGSSEERLGTLMMVEDLSDLLRAQKAQAWQEVARRIAHEIKNPLTPIQLAAQRLRKKFLAGSEDIDEVLLESTASIEHEVSGLKQLVDEFSRYARMPEVRPEPVEFGVVVESVLSLYKDLPGIRWRIELDPQTGWVRVDPRQMRRALINLIDNAVAAVGAAGEIRVATRSGVREGSLRIEIADDGPGIAAGDRDKMFVPYFSTKARGTGLGLAIVHKVVTDHQGTIRIEDNPPHGARFVIEIPA